MDMVGVTLTGAQDGWCAAQGILLQEIAGMVGGECDCLQPHPPADRIG
ncbi:MAG: hypothetical protein ACT6FE_08655 [Methanosarcinaceae archaeon]